MNDSPSSRGDGDFVRKVEDEAVAGSSGFERGAARIVAIVEELRFQYDSQVEESRKLQAKIKRLEGSESENCKLRQENLSLETRMQELIGEIRDLKITLKEKDDRIRSLEKTSSTKSKDQDDKEDLISSFLELIRPMIPEEIVSLINSRAARQGIPNMKLTLETSEICSCTQCNKAFPVEEVIDLEFPAGEDAHFWSQKSKSLELELTKIPPDLLSALGESLKEAESIDLYLPESYQPFENKTISQNLEEILQPAINLKTLHLEAWILNEVAIDVNVQGVISGLQSIEFHGPKSKSANPIVARAVPYFTENFLSIASLNLKSIRFRKVLMTEDGVRESSDANFIAKLIEDCKDTLEELDAFLGVWGLNELVDIQCPKLKRLSLSTWGCRGHDDGNNLVMTVQSLLQNLEPLEELDITLMGEFPLSILRTLKKEAKLFMLKKFRLRVLEFTDQIQPMDWDFLEEMTKLEDISLQQNVPSFESSLNKNQFPDSDILLRIPSTTKKISLRGFHSFWEGMEPMESNIGKLLERFPKLTEVDLLRSHGAVNDKGLQSLIAKCPRLTSLSFSHCPDLTDFGISGLKKRNRNGKDKNKKTGHSLSELESLRHLTIRSCPNISTEPPNEFIVQIVRQNPSLKDIPLHMNDPLEQVIGYVSGLQEEVNSVGYLIELKPRQVGYRAPDWEDHSDNDEYVSGPGDDDEAQPAAV